MEGHNARMRPSAARSVAPATTPTQSWLPLPVRCAAFQPSHRRATLSYIKDPSASFSSCNSCATKLRKRDGERECKAKKGGYSSHVGSWVGGLAQRESPLVSKRASNEWLHRVPTHVRAKRHSVSSKRVISGRCVGLYAEQMCDQKSPAGKSVSVLFTWAVVSISPLLQSNRIGMSSGMALITSCSA